MASASVFIQRCPICGRHLEIRTRYLGKRVTCQHCQGPFVASDEEGNRLASGLHGPDLLARADRLIETANDLLPGGGV